MPFFRPFSSLGMKMLRGNTHDFAAEVFSGSVGGAVQVEAQRSSERVNERVSELQAREGR